MNAVRRVLVGVVVLALAAAALWWFQSRRDQGERERRAEMRLLRFDDREVTAIEIETPSGPWRMERDESSGAWNLVHPVEDRGDPEAVTVLLGMLRMSAVIRTLESPGPLSEYGLDPPVGRIALEGVEVPGVLLGDVVATRDGLFARVEDRPGVLVIQTDSNALRLVGSPVLLRERSLAGIALPLVRSIELSGPGGDVALERTQGSWWITRPRRLPGSDAAVTRLFEALEASEVQGYLDGTSPQQPELGLGSGSIRIVLRAGEDLREVRLGSVIGDATRAALRTDRPSPLVVPAEPLEDVATGPDRYLTERLTRVNRYEVERFRYEVGGGVLEAVKSEDETWADGSGAPLDEEAVYTLLARLLESPVRGWSSAEAATAPVTATLEFVAKGDLTGTLRFRGDGTAMRDDVPGVSFRCPVPPPPLPVPAS